ncbi:MAG: DmsC/YnfH family molybdoenzyme membrane anchor subunit [Sedimenticola sp.]
MIEDVLFKSPRISSKSTIFIHPPFSVIFFTTLIGIAQGLFLALYTGEVYGYVGIASESNSLQMMLTGSFLVIVLMMFGLFSSVFHLGRPERGWRAVSQWRTSWLSRELILLLAFTGMAALWGFIRLIDSNHLLTVLGKVEIQLSLVVGLIAAILALLLYVCTAMIYVAIKFVQEWNSPLTVINYLLLGLASGFTLTTVLASHFQSPITEFYVVLSIIFILAASISRMFSLYRNSLVKRKSGDSTALGNRYLRVRQISQVAVDGAFNSPDLYCQVNPQVMVLVKIFFPIATFILPFILVIYGWASDSINILIAAVVIKYLGLLAERWFFFAQASNLQNVYYQG